MVGGTAPNGTSIPQPSPQDSVNILKAEATGLSEAEVVDTCSESAFIGHANDVIHVISQQLGHSVHKACTRSHCR